MRYARASRPQTFATLAQAQAGAHYACHVTQPTGPRFPVACITDAEMDSLQKTEAHGAPSAINYKDGQPRVWPAPAEGWQVWRELDGKLIASAP